MCISQDHSVALELYSTLSAFQDVPPNKPSLKKFGDVFDELPNESAADAAEDQLGTLASDTEEAECGVSRTDEAMMGDEERRDRDDGGTVAVLACGVRTILQSLHEVLSRSECARSR